MTVDRIYILMQYAVNKNQQGYLSPEDFYTVINTAQNQYLDYLLGEYQKQQIGRPIPVVSFGQNQKLRTSISPLIYNIVLNPNAVTGIAAFPSDFELVDAMWSVYGVYNIRFAQQDSLNSYYRSSIDPIAENPIYLIQHEGFHFYPENIGQTRMSYVRTPPSIVWGYVLDSNGEPVYNPAASQQPVWGDMDMMEIIVRALQLVGVNLQMANVMQYANDVKNNGQ
jgi:hypothetical protein